MDISSNRSSDEDRVMQRQLYRPGQTPAAPPKGATPARSTATKATSTGAPGRGAAKTGGGKNILPMILLFGVGYYVLYGNPNQRKKALIGLAVAGWLLLLGGISYCICLPNLEDMRTQRRAIFEDDKLSFEEKRDKIREMESKLTPSQRRKMRDLDRREWTRKGNVRTVDFLKLSQAEQDAQLTKEAEERAKRWEKMRKAWGNKGPRGNRGGNNGNKGTASNGNKGGGGRQGGGGWGGGGGGGAERDISMLNSGSSPESRAGGEYKRGRAQQLGLNKGFGGR